MQPPLDVEASSPVAKPIQTAPLQQQVQPQDAEKPIHIVIHGITYDVTHFDHPGGKYILMKNPGQDRGADFDRIHSRKTKTQVLPMMLRVSLK